MTDLSILDYHEDDIRKWIPDEEFETEQGAALAILKLLRKYETEIRGFEQVLGKNVCVKKQRSIDMTIDNFMDSSPHETMQLVSLANFFRCRGTLFILAGDNVAAGRDLQRCMQLTKMCYNVSNLVDFLVYKSLWSNAQNLISFGVERHAWDEKELKFIQGFSQGRNFVELFNRFPAGEFVFASNAVRLIRKHGQTRVVTIHQTETLNLTEAMRSLTTGGVASDSSPFKDYVEKIIWRVIPEGLMVENAAITAEFMLDVYGPSLQDGVHITVLRKLRQKSSLDDWSEMMAYRTIRAYVRQYESLIVAITEQRMTWIGCELEKYYLLHGKYPLSLTELKPINARCLMDPYNDDQFNYSINVDSSEFELFSIGSSSMDLDDGWATDNYDPAEEKLKFFSDTLL